MWPGDADGNGGAGFRVFTPDEVHELTLSYAANIGVGWPIDAAEPGGGGGR